MSKEEYIAKRQKLLNKARILNNNGKKDDAQALLNSVDILDDIYEQVAIENANTNANNGNLQIPDFVVNGGKTMDEFDSIEYRKAFMNYVVNGLAIPNKFINSDANTKTTDVGAIIPTVVLDRIIEKIESKSVLLPLITRTSYRGGLSIPTSSVKPVATWVAEGAGSDKQKKTTGTITFAYYKLRCAVSVSLETDTMALSAFEATIINNISDAMCKSLDAAIVNGDGVGKPKGIMAETPVDGQTVETTVLDYPTICNVEAALPIEYEDGAAWFTSKKTFMKFIAMTDNDGQPIARINYGIGGKPERFLLGRNVYLTNDITDESTVAFIFNPADYVLNTNLDITIKTYEDNDTDDIVKKAVMLVDGKVIDKNSLVKLNLKSSND